MSKSYLVDKIERNARHRLEAVRSYLHQIGRPEVIAELDAEIQNAREAEKPKKARTT